ncbi:hypothetical protein DFH09DRAFT_1367568 [Mycena vulgaris]|nr:hypothetical protein DFH09DRAFT_1367568 [Mycena vulgaris]
MPASSISSQSPPPAPAPRRRASASPARDAGVNLKGNGHHAQAHPHARHLDPALEAEADAEEDDDEHKIARALAADADARRRALEFLMRESERHRTSGTVWYILGVNFVLTFYPIDVAILMCVLLSYIFCYVPCIFSPPPPPLILLPLHPPPAPPPASAPPPLRLLSISFPFYSRRPSLASLAHPSRALRPVHLLAMRPHVVRARRSLLLPCTSGRVPVLPLTFPLLPRSSRMVVCLASTFDRRAFVPVALFPVIPSLP